MNKFKNIADCRLPIADLRSAGGSGFFDQSLANWQTAMAIGNRQWAIGNDQSAIGNAQSAMPNWQSAIGNVIVQTSQLAQGEPDWQQKI
ncbi:MAG TPA: hypothetical protein VK893_06455 [Pyrinomonadaceae bacterium]|nr:hypothetical protein [Pyrinomonadaceae bacterium]